MNDRTYDVPFLRGGDSAPSVPGQVWPRDTMEGTISSRPGAA